MRPPMISIICTTSLELGFVFLVCPGPWSSDNHVLDLIDHWKYIRGRRSCLQFHFDFESSACAFAAIFYTSSVLVFLYLCSVACFLSAPRPILNSVLGLSSQVLSELWRLSLKQPQIAFSSSLSRMYDCSKEWSSILTSSAN